MATKKTIPVEKCNDERENMRILKFKTLIEDVSGRLTERSTGGILHVFASSFYRRTRKCLPLIFNCEDFNDYAKVIYDNSDIYISFSDDSEQSDFCKQFPLSEKFDDGKQRIDAGTALVRKLNSDKSQKSAAYKFIFWSLMVLAVDDKNKDEYLSLICDYARMFKISDDEMKDMVNVIKYIFQDKTAQPIKTENVLSIFGTVLQMYKY